LISSAAGGDTANALSDFTLTVGKIQAFIIAITSIARSAGQVVKDGYNGYGPLRCILTNREGTVTFAKHAPG